MSLPVPMFNILNGGRHASNSTDVQDFMVMPVGLDSFSQSLRAGSEIYHALRGLLRDGRHNLNVGDEGGFAPSLPSNKDAIEIVLKAIESAGYAPGSEVCIALDVAATELYDSNNGNYVLEREGTTLSAPELVELYAKWCAECLTSGRAEDVITKAADLGQCTQGVNVKGLIEYHACPNPAIVRDYHDTYEMRAAPMCAYHAPRDSHFNLQAAAVPLYDLHKRRYDEAEARMRLAAAKALVANVEEYLTSETE